MLVFTSSKRMVERLLLGLPAAALAFTLGLQDANAQGVIVYPAQGQSGEQQAKDEYECRGWAGQQTGFNPGQPPPQAQSGSQGGGIVRGAAGGAALGAVGGAIGGDAGKGAAIGAGVGAAAGLLRRGQANRQQQQAQQQANAEYSQRQGDYNRAFAACMQGRGYTVN